MKQDIININKNDLEKLNNNRDSQIYFYNLKNNKIEDYNYNIK
jgi:hypothetical protein